jgi:hypothetical protein
MRELAAALASSSSALAMSSVTSCAKPSGVLKGEDTDGPLGWWITDLSSLRYSFGPPTRQSCGVMPHAGVRCSLLIKNHPALQQKLCPQTLGSAHAQHRRGRSHFGRDTTYRHWSPYKSLFAAWLTIKSLRLTSEGMWEWSFAPRRNLQFKRNRVSEVPPNEPIRASCRVVQKCRLFSRQGAQELGERGLDRRPLELH